MGTGAGAGNGNGDGERGLSAGSLLSVVIKKYRSIF